MAVTRINSQDILSGSVGPNQAQLTNATSWAFQGGLSGSLQHTSTGASYLVAGSNVTITSASNGQVTIASTGGGGGLSVSNFIFNQEVTGVNGVAAAFTLPSTPSPGTSLRVFKNGMRMMSGSGNDYLLGGGIGRTLTFQAGSVPTSGSNIIFDYMV